jgi:hypothetical protein
MPDVNQIPDAEPPASIGTTKALPVPSPKPDTEAVEVLENEGGPSPCDVCGRWDCICDN